MESSLTINLLQSFIIRGKINKKLLSYDSKPYFHFLKFFEDLSRIEEHHFYIAASFVYSWMPTMLKTVSSNECVLNILNRVKNGGDVDEYDLKVLIESINNSLVGVSKLLHFIAPDRYAIWDSRVYRSIFNREYYMDRKGIIEEFITYTKCARKLTQLSDYDMVHNYILTEIDTQEDLSKLTRLRTLELVLYASDHDIKNSKLRR